MTEFSRVTNDDLELFKIIIKDNYDLGLDIDTLFKNCKIIKEKIDDNIYRYYISYIKELEHITKINRFVRLFITEYDIKNNKLTILFNM